MQSNTRESWRDGNLELLRTVYAMRCLICSLIQEMSLTGSLNS